MAFNFDQLLQEGKIAAENVQKNMKEIQDVLDDLETSLSSFLNLNITFEERIEYVESGHPLARLTNPFIPREITGFNIVYIKSLDVSVEKEIFKIKRFKDGYPVTLAGDQSQIISDDQSEFASAIGQVVSDAQFHLLLNSFKRRVNEELVKNQQQSS